MPAMIACLRQDSHTKRGQKTQLLARGKPGRRSDGCLRRKIPLCSGWTFSKRSVVENVNSSLTRLPSGPPVAAVRRSSVFMCAGV